MGVINCLKQDNLSTIGIHSKVNYINKNTAYVGRNISTSSLFTVCGFHCVEKIVVLLNKCTFLFLRNPQNEFLESLLYVWHAFGDGGHDEHGMRSLQEATFQRQHIRQEVQG